MSELGIGPADKERMGGPAVPPPEEAYHALSDSNEGDERSKSDEEEPGERSKNQKVGKQAVKVAAKVEGPYSTYDYRARVVPLGKPEERGGKVDRKV